VVRQATEFGLIGSGMAVSACYRSAQWTPRLHEDAMNLVDVCWDMVLDADEILPIDQLEAADLGVPWQALMASGIQVPARSVERLEQLWSDHLIHINRLRGDDAAGASHQTIYAVEQDKDETIGVNNSLRRPRRARYFAAIPNFIKGKLYHRQNDIHAIFGGQERPASGLLLGE
jgi:hypothetical protein